MSFKRLFYPSFGDMVGRGWANSIAHPWVLISSLLTHMVYLLTFFFWVPSNQDTMTNTAVEATPSASSRGITARLGYLDFIYRGLPRTDVSKYVSSTPLATSATSMWRATQVTVLKGRTRNKRPTQWWWADPVHRQQQATGRGPTANGWPITNWDLMTITAPTQMLHSTDLSKVASDCPIEYVVFVEMDTCPRCGKWRSENDPCTAKDLQVLEFRRRFKALKQRFEDILSKIKNEIMVVHKWRQAEAKNQIQVAELLHWQSKSHYSFIRLSITKMSYYWRDRLSTRTNGESFMAANAPGDV